MSTAIILALLGLFSALLWCIRRPSAGPVKVSAPVPAAPNTLNGLPAELILLISSFLSPLDLVCFLISSRWLYIVLKGQLTKIPNPTASQKLSILRRLDRDLLDTFVCHRCASLHKFNECREFLLPGRLGWSMGHRCLRPWNINPEHILRLYEPESVHANYDLYFLHLQLVMKQFYRGAGAGISIDSLSHVQVHLSASADVTALFCQEAQVCGQPPSFHLRIQDIILFHSGEIALRTGPFRDLQICFHERNWELMLTISELVKIMQYKVSNQQETKFSHRFADRCEICNTHYEVELASFGKERAVIVTRWMDLGTGVDPRDPRWAIHTSSRTLRDFKRKHAPWLRPGHVRASPRASFEKTCAMENSFKETLSRNLFYLQDANYRKLMKKEHWIPPTWALKKRPARWYS